MQNFFSLRPQLRLPDDQTKVSDPVPTFDVDEPSTSTNAVAL